MTDFAKHHEEILAAFDQNPSLGLSALVVGGGIAGLIFAIEATRKGIACRIIERRPHFAESGDAFNCQSSALRTLKKWPYFYEAMRASSMEPYASYYRFDGTFITRSYIGDDEGNACCQLQRSDFMTLLTRYVEVLGIPVEFNHKVVEYFETEQFGGVLLDDDRRLTADLVVAADGIGGKSHKLILGRVDRAVSTGYSVHRSNFSLEHLANMPSVLNEIGQSKDRVAIIVGGTNAHAVIAHNEKSICWIITHKDETGRKDYLYKPGEAKDVFPYIHGWAPWIHDLVTATPSGVTTDWKLMWRDPHPNWVSPKGKVVQIGDAAHAFIPSSGYGASMAVEDGYSLATCLQLSGKDNIELGARVHNILRFQRTSCAQKYGFRAREIYHNIDWDEVAKNPDSIHLWGKWMWKHDPEQYVYDNYDKCADSITSGNPFDNTNYPPGHSCKPWTVEELTQASEEGKELEYDGDWS
ncbi:unnamed protein product [Clonostachys byssicola]|uniref:FAD-binding domain-containing protein n=1 Tax=Clonostachys byssicola TaxID=160290 RepID=A0A9N9U657_9HYPO|nr:unnamed protein product [Clonostachys byssicola]